MYTPKLFGYLASRSIELALSAYDRRRLARHGVCDRERRIGEENLRTATNVKQPQRFFNHFTRPGLFFHLEAVTELAARMEQRVISFPSPFLQRRQETAAVRAALYRGRAPSRTAVIVVGSVGTSFGSLEHRFCRSIARQGLDCCLIELPYHATRSACHPNGWCWIAEDPVATAESFIQAVLDVDRLASILTTRYDYAELGLVGVSFGGNITHAATFLRPYTGAVLTVSGASPASIVWQAEGPFWDRIRLGMARHGYSFADVETLWRMSDTTRYQPPSRCERVLMMNGVFDRLVTPRHARNLHAAIPDCQIIWYPTGHGVGIALMTKPAVENIARFFNGLPLRDTGLKPRTS